MAQHESAIQYITATAEDAGKRLDQFLVSHIPDVSRARVQQLIGQQKVQVDGKPAKPSLKLRGGERIEILGDVQPAPLRAIAEEIPLEIVYEDDDLVVINKPAGMMVHAGAGATEDARNRGTLVNALLHRFGNLSGVGGDLRPGIVHRLDRQTSGLMIVAKNDIAHRKLANAFASRRVHKTYIALVQGWLKQRSGTISSPISRDRIRRTRMTTKLSGGREAVSHYRVVEQFESAYGKFSLLEVKIETGRTHQIRVHMASLGHPVVGDTLYGATGEINPPAASSKRPDIAPSLKLGRNFLHSAEIRFEQPKTGSELAFSRSLPMELQTFLEQLRSSTGH
ncbi:MAG TPA: RluA family pseudouridine synthase [Terriglobales bacterium]|nr:RluA family pseudouridine synthase [Terriglobales bacterium]